MNNETWQKLKEIFDQAHVLEGSEREAFIEKRCGDDQELRAEAEKLIASYDSEFLEEPSLADAGRILSQNIFESGKVIGRYRLRELIGEGGMGQVFLADDTELDRPVAFKFLHADVAEDDERVRRFIQEARAASALNHPNILTIYEVGSFEGSRFIVSEYVNGDTLRERMHRGLGIYETIDITCQITAALQAAHAAGIVHRDIKPENVMIRRDGLVKVLDFGLAKLTEADDRPIDPNAPIVSRIHTSPGLVMGTVAYMSPEQAKGQPVDARSDLWSLGVVFHEMLTGRSPFDGDSVTDLISSILKTETITVDDEHVPTELRPICRKALTGDKLARYQSADDLLKDLQGEKKRMEYAINSTSYITVSTNDDQKTQLIRRRPTLSAEYIVTSVKRHKYATFTAVLVVLSAAIGFSVFRYNGATPPSSNKLPNSAVINEATTEKDLKFTKFTGQGRIFDIAISPDGKYIAYTTGEVAHSEAIHIRELSTQRDTEVVPAPAEEGETTFLNRMTFAPDNSRILYRRQTPDNLQIYSVPLAGGPSVKLADHTWAASISPDGRNIVFYKQTLDEKGSLRGSDLVITDIEGRNERIIAHYNIDDSSDESASTEVPAWSPDGKAIAGWFDFDEGDLFHQKLYAISTADGSKQLLSDQKWDYISSAVWMPDGSLVITAREYQGGDNEPLQLWRVTRTEATRITTETSGYNQIKGTRDGKALVTIQSVQRRDLWVVTGNDSRTARQVTFSGEIAKYSGYSQVADGSVVFTSRLFDRDMWSISLDGKTRKQLTKNAGTNIEDRTTPDGRFIVFTSDRDGANRVYRMDADGGNVTRLTDKPRTRCISISRDGKFVYYRATDDESRQIYKIPIEGGPSTLVANVSIKGTWYDISPDGRIAEFYYDVRLNKKELRLYSADDKMIKSIPLPQSAGPDMPIHWTPDAKAVAFNDLRVGASYIWMIPVDGKRTSKPLITFGPGVTADFNWSRDRKQMFVTRNTLINDGWLITNNRQ